VRSKLVVIAILALVTLSVAGLLLHRRASAARSRASLDTAQVTRRTLNATVVATGSIKAIVGAEVKVGSRISGVVKRLPVNIGSTVRKGQLIAELDDRETRSQADQANANLASARTHRAELEAGYGAQVVQSRTDVERAQADLAAARSRLEQARTTVGTVPLEVTAQIQQAKAAVEQAEASRANAKAKYDRIQHLLEQDFVAKQDADNARTEYEVAVAQVRHAQAVLDTANANASQTQLKQQDVAQAEEAVHQADSALRMARANTAQVRVKEQAIRTARAQVMQAEAALRYAETQLSYTRIVSPIDGVIASVSTQEGETIAAGLTAPTFVTIIDLSRLQVDALVDETDIGRVKVGQSATFSVDSFPDEEFEGKVTAIYPKAIIDQNVVDYDVVVTITNPRGLLRPDMTANVTINVATKENVLAVPNKAVKREEGEKVVYVIQNGVPVRRPVKIGWKDSDYTEVLSGLKEGDSVLVGELPGSGQKQPAAQPSLPPGAAGR
jgi:macrolide-specific efflux system membrane fusion protein